MSSTNAPRANDREGDAEQESNKHQSSADEKMGYAGADVTADTDAAGEGPEAASSAESDDDHEDRLPSEVQAKVPPHRSSADEKMGYAGADATADTDAGGEAESGATEDE